MKKAILSLAALAVGLGQLAASQRLNVLYETFANVDGSIEAPGAIDQSKFDNPSGWTFTNAFAGPQCILIKKGGSITTPPLAELTGNAAYWFSAGWWEDPDRKPEEEPTWEPHTLSLTGKGELYTDQYDSMSSRMGADVIYDVDGTTRLTLTASYDIMVDNVSIYYAGNANADAFSSDYTLYSHESGDYFTPFDLKLTKSTVKLAQDDGEHNILVYTTDGTDPARTSKRYDGTPIHIDATTTVKTATIFGDGYMYRDVPRTYTFPQQPTPEKPQNTFELTVSAPGNLKTQLLNLDAEIIEGLVIKGKINGADLKYLSGAEGRTASLSYIDMTNLTFEYDNTEYRTIVDAPEAGMGTTYTYHYYLSEENTVEGVGGSPTSRQYNVYRNNLAGAFRKHPTLRTVILPAFITSLGERIFEQCRELVSVQFPPELTSVGVQAFYFCDNLELYDFPATFREIGAGAFAGVKLGNVRLDKKVEIGESAFTSSTIVKLDMPLPPDSIPYHAFSYCYRLEEINIGEGLEYIGLEAFYNSKIKTARLPQSLQEIAGGAFADCPFVKDIEPENGIRYIGSIAYELADNSLSEYTVKPGTVTLAPRLFTGTSATTFNLPESLERVGEGAFAGTQLSSIPQMPSLRVIGSEAFSYCQKLGRITIPETVEYIGSGAFTGCNALWSVTYNAIDARCEGRLSPRDLEVIVVGDKVRRLPAGLYTGNTNVTQIILPKSVEVLDPNVFENCVNLEYVRLSDNINTISDNAFYNCTSLSDLHWPANLKNIGTSAFSWCTSLKTISLPEGVESVGYNAFGYSSAVENLYIASTVTDFGEACFLFDSAPKPLTITTTAKTPQDYQWNWHYVGPATIKVPAASLAAYQASSNWNGSNNGKNNVIIPLEGITAPEEETQTSFNYGIDDQTDLSDTVVGDVYVTIGEDDGYDVADGSIVLNSSMDEEYVEAIGGMAPGESDLANRFNGLVLQVPGGTGKITVNCLTIGSKQVAVKIGEAEPSHYTKDSKGDITIEYNVPLATYVYIYAIEPDAQQQMRRLAVSADAAGSVKIYSVGVNPLEISGVEKIAAATREPSPVTEYYRIDGTRIQTPSTPGVYIIRRADGKVAKILVR